MTRQGSDPENLAAATLPDDLELADTQQASQHEVRQFLGTSVTKSKSGVLTVRSPVKATGIFASPEAKRAKRAEAKASATAATSSTAEMAVALTQEQQIANILEAMAILPGIASQVTEQNKVLAAMQQSMTSVMGEVFDEKVKPLESRMNMLEEKIALCSTSGSSVGAGTGSATGMTHMSISVPKRFERSSMDFVPRWVEIKGWVTIFQSRAGAIQEGQALG